MSMGWDYVSELRPPTGLLFVTQVIYEHGEQCWSNIDRGRLLIRPPELSGNHKSSHLVAKQEELAKEMNFALEASRASKGSLTCQKILRHWADVSFEGSAADFYRPRPGLNPRNLGPTASTLAIRPPITNAPRSFGNKTVWINFSKILIWIKKNNKNFT
jgi:hypothetical protein